MHFLALNNKMVVLLSPFCQALVMLTYALLSLLSFHASLAHKEMGFINNENQDPHVYTLQLMFDSMKSLLPIDNDDHF